MNYSTQQYKLNKEIDDIISSVTDALTEENNVFEFMWKEGIINGAEVYGIERSSNLHSFYGFSIITNKAHKIHNIGDVNGNLADIILQDRKYRIENGFGTTTHSDMMSIYGHNWFGLEDATGKTLEFACNNWNSEELLIVVRGVGIEVPNVDIDSISITPHYHDVMINDEIVECISITIE